MDSTLLITIISGIILFVQALLLFLGRKFGWTMYIKPIWLIVWFIIFIGGLYSLITGNKIIG